MGAAASRGRRLRAGGDPLTRRVVLDTALAAETLYAYLADPRNRPAWQSSLRRIEDLHPGPDGPLTVGTSWTDVTAVPGIRPRMRTTAAEPGRRWAEDGRFGPMRAVLELAFAPRPDGCRVEADFSVVGAGVGGLVAAIARPAIAADLRRAVTLAGG